MLDRECASLDSIPGADSAQITLLSPKTPSIFACKSTTENSEYSEKMDLSVRPRLPILSVEGLSEDMPDSRSWFAVDDYSASPYSFAPRPCE